METKSGKIVFFIPTLEAGGAERNILEIANEFAGRGLDVHLALVHARGPLMEKVSPGVKVHQLKGGKTLLSIPMLSSLLRRERPDVVFSAMDYANVTAIWAKKLSGIKARMVVSERTTLSVNARNSRGLKAKLVPLLVKLSYRSADAVVAVSHGVAEDIARVTGIHVEKIRVIYNPVVTPALLEQADEPVSHRWFSTGAPQVVIGVGRLHPAKDFGALIRAFAKVRTETDSRLLILGEGGERAKLEALIASLGLGEFVELYGFSANPYAYMKKAALFVLSSAWEGLPTVLIEAMACGTPVVSTDCQSGPREVLQCGRLAPLVPVGDADALSSAILDSLKERPDTTPLVQRAMEFSRSKAADAYYEAAFGNRA